MPSTSLRLPGNGVGMLLREVAPKANPPRRARRWITWVLALAGAAVLALLVSADGGQFLRAIERAFSANWHLVAVAVIFEAGSIAGYVFLFHRVVARSSRGLRLKDSYDITLGSSAATRLLPTAGLGGVAVTVWALRARGVAAKELAERLLAFLLLINITYMVFLLAGGAAVAAGLVHVGGGRVLGMLGVGLAITVTATVLITCAAPALVARALSRAGGRSVRLASPAQRVIEQLPVLQAALHRSRLELRRPHPALVGAVAWWGFDVAVLLTMLHAFGVRLSVPAVVLAYFLGTLFNAVPLPGSLSGGLVGCLVALGSPAGGAVAAVLAYRTVAVWLPAAPGIASLIRLRSSVESWRATSGGYPYHHRPVPRIGRRLARRDSACTHGWPNHKERANDFPSDGRAAARR